MNLRTILLAAAAVMAVSVAAAPIGPTETNFALKIKHREANIKKFKAELDAAKKKGDKKAAEAARFKYRRAKRNIEKDKKLQRKKQGELTQSKFNYTILYETK